MKTLYLSNGKECLVDDQDYENLKSSNWYENGGYAYYQGIPMARLLLSPQDDMMVDHINGNKLDNRRSNLRICDRAQNRANSAKHKNKTSKFKGVCFVNRAGKWMAYIHLLTKFKTIGYFETQEEAANAYNIKAIEHFGEFAKLNVI